MQFVIFFLFVQCVTQCFQARLMKRNADCSAPPSVFNKTEKESILKIHNRIREEQAVLLRSSGMIRMKWNEDLASRAQEWANDCVPGAHGKAYRCSDDEPLGQNLFSISSNKNYNVPTVDYIMSRFEEEGAWYDSKADSCTVPAQYSGRNCGHFTQLIWESSNEVGCGMSKCMRPNDSRFYTIFVCDYYPGGNIQAVSPITDGEPCTQCPSQPIAGAGYKCSKNLCDHCMVGSNDPSCKCNRECEFGTLNPNTCTCDCDKNHKGVTCSERCGDQWEDRCPVLKNSGLCDSKHALFPMMKINCPVTCGYACE